jgi:succinate dehydrogenase / fumarate reductase flavoprotein subunit
MGGLWVDYDLMTTVPGLFALGECNFSDHGANRLGASALMQALADGYFIVPGAIAGYLAGAHLPPVSASTPAVRDTLVEAETHVARLLRSRGDRTAGAVHRELGQLLADACGLSRERTRLLDAARRIADLRASFEDVVAPGSANELNPELERKARLRDFLELGALMCLDAVAREESCGCHFREEHQTSAGEPLRDDAGFAHVAAYRYAGEQRSPERLIEPLQFESMDPVARSYA